MRRELFNFVREVETAMALLSMRVRAFLTGGKITIGKNPRVRLSACIRLCKNSELTIGNDFLLGPNSQINLRENARLWIGDNVSLTDNVSINCMGEMRIDTYAGFGPYCFVTDFNHDYKQLVLSQRHLHFTSKNVVVGHDVWLGAHVVVLPGVTIGKEAVVGANSTVTRDVSAYAVVVGSPAKTLQERRKEATE